MKKIVNFLIGRLFISILLLVLQVALFCYAIWRLSNYFIYIYIILLILTVYATLYLLTKPLNPSYKVTWLIVLLLFPGVGTIVYCLYGTRRLSRKQEKQLSQLTASFIRHRTDDSKLLSHLQLSNHDAFLQANYLSQFGGFSLFQKTKTTFLSPGEVKFNWLLRDLKQAKHYIFLEYFIIEEGDIWSQILEILTQKVHEGVEVRVIYDDVGCLNRLPFGYEKKLHERGIKCVVFNRIGHVFNIRYNNRDHRKIAVIDGYIGYTGGINIGDEYINVNQHLGHWKDAALCLKGEAVWNLTLMFLQHWSYITKVQEDYTSYKPHLYAEEVFESDGYVLPYGDSPLDDEIVGEMAYLNMINRAKNYLYISTPYLIVDNELVTALSLAAKSGVDVRITTPHVPDKWYVHLITRGYYLQLLKAGVKIYEYTPGFLHAKTFVCDDLYAIVGTINLDFRSLYLHFECATWLYNTSSVFEVKADYEQMLTKCQSITVDECQKLNFFTKLIRAILLIFAPLM